MGWTVVQVNPSRSNQWVQLYFLFLLDLIFLHCIKEQNLNNSKYKFGKNKRIANCRKTISYQASAIYTVSLFIAEKKTSKVDLNGKKIVFTGALSKATRKQAAARAKMFGCIVVAGVSKNVDIVIAGTGAGQKLDRAEDLGMNQ